MKYLPMLLLSLLTWLTATGASASPPAAPTPLDAGYLVDGQYMALHQGIASRAAAPGSAMQATLRIAGPPMHGDIDGDGDADAVLWLAYSAGGSGTFFYVAAAIRDDAGYRGSNAVFIGDRITPQALSICNGVVIADYADRSADQAMAVPASIGDTRHLVWQDGRLRTLSDGNVDEELLQGWLVWGHEVRTFQPCGEHQVLWLSGSPDTLHRLKTAYQDAMRDAPPYSPLFVSLVGHRTTAPEEGFGSGHAQSLQVGRLVRAWPRGSCDPPP